jgi:hypothetical protein
MERIVLEVNDSIAKKWRISSSRLRSQMSRFIADQIDQILDKSEPEDSIRFFDELRSEMKDKGLTQKKLEEILHDA